MHQKQLDRASALTGEDKDLGMGYMAYLMGREWSSRAANFTLYREGVRLAETEWGNKAHAGMLRSA